ncbi:MAG: hypothetical protein ABI462_07270 [Ignavibacteria bacterium]
MKKINLLFLVLTLALFCSSLSYSQPNVSTSIPSGQARFEALGYNPFLIDAATDLNRNPAWGGVYKNYAFGEIGAYSTFNDNKDSTYVLRDQYAGVNFRLGSQWAAGLIVNKNEGEIFSGDIRTTYRGLGISDPIVPIKLLAAYTSKNMSFGLAPYFARWSGVFLDSGDGGLGVSLDNSSSVFGATLGLVATQSGNSWTEGAITIRKNSYESVRKDTSAPTVTFDNDGGLEFNVFGRGYYKMGGGSVKLVPYVSFASFNWDPVRSPVLIGASTNEYSKWSILAGIGINMPVAGDGLIVGGISGGYLSDKLTTTAGSSGSTTESKVNSLILPQFNVGLEWNLTSWLMGRVGFARAIIDRKFEATTTGTSSGTFEFSELVASNPDQTITLGVGWQVDRFSLDGLMGERFFQTGPNILSGKENDLFGRLSMSYNFRTK